MIKSREIRQIIHNRLSGNWWKVFSMSATYIIIIHIFHLILTFIQSITETMPKLNYFLHFFGNLIYLLLILQLSYGLVSAITKFFNGNDSGYKTVIEDTISNGPKALKIFFITIIRITLPAILVIIISRLAFIGLYKIINIFHDTFNISILLENNIIPILYYIFIYLIIAIFSLPYSLAIYALANETNLSETEAINKSIKLLNGNKWNFIKLLLSFFDFFFILIICRLLPFNTLKVLAEGISSIFILPFIISSIAIFYDELNNVQESNTKND